MLRATPVAKGFISELDGLRGVAILLVMVHRFWPRNGVENVAADAAGAGWIGVDLFFVISGFLIAGILLDTKGEQGYFRNFYARRALRIFPLYYLFVGGVLLAFSTNAAFREDAGSPLWYLFHLGNVPEGVLGHDVPYWLGPVWSLAIEEQFYLTFPLLVYFLDRKRLVTVLIAMLAAAPLVRLGTMLALPQQERVQYLVTFCRLDTIAIGCLLAVGVRKIDVARWRRPLFVGAAGILAAAALAGVLTGLDRTTPFGRTLGYSVVAFGCASVVMLVVLARDTATTTLLRWEGLRYFGKLCFGLYLLHRPADTIVTAGFGRVDIDAALWLMPVKIAVALGLATLSWHLLEQPFLRLKDRFASVHHPSAAALAATPQTRFGLVRSALRALGILLVLLVACSRSAPPSSSVPDATGDDVDAIVELDATTSDATPDTPPDAPPDAPLEPVRRIVYAEGRRHSPITQPIVDRLRALAATAIQQPQVFAKIGDSHTATTDFLACFAGGNANLGAHASLASTIAYFDAGDAAGASPFGRVSVAAVGGTTSRDALDGAECPLQREIETVDPRLAVIMFGTNEIRYGWAFDDFGASLWELVDRTLGHGVVPVMSTIPPIGGDPGTDARIPTANRIVRAIAQGREVLLVDLHRELVTLPNRGLASDQLHLSVAPAGACALTTDGLRYGQNVRNLITVEALARARAALAGEPSDGAAPQRAGTGTASDPFRATLPLADLADTRTGVASLYSYSCAARAQAGRELVYELDLAAAKTIEANVVDRDEVDVDVHIIGGQLVGGACLASGDRSARATAGPGKVFVVVDSPSATHEGEMILVVDER